MVLGSGFTDQGLAFTRWHALPVRISVAVL